MMREGVSKQSLVVQIKNMTNHGGPALQVLLLSTKSV